MAFAFGGVWLARAGVLIAVLAGTVALLLAWRAVARTTRRQREHHATQVREQMAAHREEVRSERADTMAVLDTLEGRFAVQRQQSDVLEHRVRTLRGQVKGLRGEIAALVPELSGLRRDKTVLTRRVSDQDALVAQLRGELERRESELRALADREVVSMPRRGGAMFTAEQIWADGEHPDVVDLRAAGGVMMPEADRRQA